MANTTYQYSGSFDLLKVLPALKNRVMWKSEGTSKSGRYFDDGSFHAMVVETAYRELQPDGKISDADFANLLCEFGKAAAMRSLNAVFSGQTVIDQPVLLHDVSVARQVTGASQAELTGYEICVADAQDMVTQIKSAVLHFDTVGNVTLYLHKLGDTTPLWSQSCAFDANRYTVVDLTDCYLSYRAEKQATFFFGYKPADIAGIKAYIGDEIMENCYCAFNARPADVTIPGYDDSTVYPSRPYGLNLELSSMWDYTDMIIRSASKFDELIGLCGAAMFLESALFSNRINGDKRAIQDNQDRFAVQMDLTGSLPVTDSPQVDGLRSRIYREIKAVKSSFTRKKGAVV